MEDEANPHLCPGPIWAGPRAAGAPGGRRRASRRGWSGPTRLAGRTCRRKRWLAQPPERTLC